MSSLRMEVVKPLLQTQPKGLEDPVEYRRSHLSRVYPRPAALPDFLQLRVYIQHERRGMAEVLRCNPKPEDPRLAAAHASPDSGARETPDLHSPLIGPMYGDPTGLPPTDILLPDARRYTRQARAAGAQIELHEYRGTIQVFPGATFTPEAGEGNVLTRMARPGCFSRRLSRSCCTSPGGANSVQEQAELHGGAAAC